MDLSTASIDGDNLSIVTRNDLESRFAAIQSGWLVEHTQQGQHKPAISRPIVPAEFFTDGAPTDVTVYGTIAGQTFLYLVRGSRMWVQLLIRAATVANTPLVIKALIPDGWVPTHDGVTTGWASNAGTFAAIAIGIVAGSRHMSMSIIPSATWTNGTSSFGFTWEFNVRRP